MNVTLERFWKQKSQKYREYLKGKMQIITINEEKTNFQTFSTTDTYFSCQST